MDLREKLIGLLNICVDDNIELDDGFVGYGVNYSNIADCLIKNGVTVQEWIPVTERLPEKSGKYLVSTNRGNVYQTKFYSYPEDKGGHWGQKDKGKSITHWTPLPEPPKGD